MLGNRGVLHDDQRRIVRYSQMRRWIACRLHYRDVRRELMRPRSWTELFFLDEATALGAGHRPCAFCRHADYKHFCALWQDCFGTPARADVIDWKLHADRLCAKKKRTYRSDLGRLPDGAYIARDSEAWLVWEGNLLAWSPTGYKTRIGRPVREKVEC